MLEIQAGLSTVFGFTAFCSKYNAGYKRHAHKVVNAHIEILEMKRKHLADLEKHYHLKRYVLY
jgi:hypothetical protein